MFTGLLVVGIVLLAILILLLVFYMVMVSGLFANMGLSGAAALVPGLNFKSLPEGAVEAGPFLKAALIIGGIALAILIILWMMAILWGVFKKMGMNGPVGLIPFLNAEILFRKVWTKKGFWAMVGCMIGLFVLHIPSILTKLGVSFTYQWLGAPLTFDPGVQLRVLLIMFGSALIIVILALIFGLCAEISKKFGRKGAFAVGLFFLPIVFGAILAFRKDVVYVAKEEEAKYVALDETAGAKEAAAENAQ